MELTRDFKVVAKSDNTNSFGLYQMIVVAKDGKAYCTHASMYHVKERGEILPQRFNMDKDGIETGHHFIGCELTTKEKDCPKDVVANIWKDELKKQTHEQAKI